MEGILTKALDDECERTKNYTVYEITKALCRVMYQFNSIGMSHQHAAYEETEPPKADA